MATVSTREELKAAQASGAPEITVIGDLADKLKKTKKIASLSAVSLAAIVALAGVATVTVPASGGLSYALVAPVAALTGVEIIGIITALFLGLGLVLAIFNGYEEISFERGRLVLRKKSK